MQFCFCNGLRLPLSDFMWIKRLSECDCKRSSWKSYFHCFIGIWHHKEIWNILFEINITFQNLRREYSFPNNYTLLRPLCSRSKKCIIPWKTLCLIIIAYQSRIHCIQTLQTFLNHDVCEEETICRWVCYMPRARFVIIMDARVDFPPQIRVEIDAVHGLLYFF